MTAADPGAFADLTVRKPCEWEIAEKLFRKVEQSSNGLFTLGQLLKVVDRDAIDDELSYQGLGDLLDVIAEGLNKYAEDGYTLRSARKHSGGSCCASGSTCAMAMPPGQKLPPT